MMNQNHRTLTPAYGRDYKSKAAVLADWNANKDFVLQPDGAYINAEQVGLNVTLNVRSRDSRKLWVITTAKVWGEAAK